MAKVLVFAEQRDGKLKKAGLEAISEGQRLASASGGQCTAVVVGSGIQALAPECGRYGADAVLGVDAPELGSYGPESYRDAVLAAVQDAGPDVLLFPATAMGSDLAARTAARLDVGAASDVVSLQLKDGGLEALRPIYAGKVMATVRISGRPAIATLRPNVFRLEPSGKTPAFKALAAPAGPGRARVVGVEKSEGAEIDVAEADVVVSGGRGLKGPEHFALIKELARALGGAVGASRAVVDAGWIDHVHQVGQTGKTVSPKLYVAVGISGAIQHLAGMSSSKIIVAINKDAEAPIFKTATYGVVGDLFEVVPALTEAIRLHKAAHG